MSLVPLVRKTGGAVYISTRAVAARTARGRCRRPIGSLAAALLSALLLSAPAGAQTEASATDTDLARCPTSASLDGRLLMEQWAPPGDCALPTRTRVTDRFLGFTCVGENAEAPRCRGYVPPLDSWAFDTSQHFRCVDIGISDDSGALAVDRMREWVAPQRKCEWSPDLNLLASEVDFSNGYICAGPLCMPTDRLTVIGALRLRYLIEKAFRELDMMAWTMGPQLVSPVRVDGR